MLQMQAGRALGQRVSKFKVIKLLFSMNSMICTSQRPYVAALDIADLTGHCRSHQNEAFELGSIVSLHVARAQYLYSAHA